MWGLPVVDIFHIYFTMLEAVQRESNMEEICGELYDRLTKSVGSLPSGLKMLHLAVVKTFFDVFQIDTPEGMMAEDVQWHSSWWITPIRPRKLSLGSTIPSARRGRVPRLNRTRLRCNLFDYIEIHDQTYNLAFPGIVGRVIERSMNVTKKGFKTPLSSFLDTCIMELDSMQTLLKFLKGGDPQNRYLVFARVGRR